MTLKGLFFMPA